MALGKTFIETKALQALREASSWDLRQVLMDGQVLGLF